VCVVCHVQMTWAAEVVEANHRRGGMTEASATTAGSASRARRLRSTSWSLSALR
jgi:hypothetical protein